MKVVDTWDRICQIRDTVQKRPCEQCYFTKPQIKRYLTYTVDGDLASGDIVAGKDWVGPTIIAPVGPDK